MRRKLGSRIVAGAVLGSDIIPKGGLRKLLPGLPPGLSHRLKPIRPALSLKPSRIVLPVSMATTRAVMTGSRAPARLLVFHIRELHHPRPGSLRQRLAVAPRARSKRGAAGTDPREGGASGQICQFLSRRQARTNRKPSKSHALRLAGQTGTKAAYRRLERERTYGSKNLAR